jgi:hypothetical protein
MTIFNQPKPPKKVPVTVEALKEWQRLVIFCSRGVHSNAHMQNADKVPILGALARLKKGLASHIQLELFSDEQLDFD